MVKLVNRRIKLRGYSVVSGGPSGGYKTDANSLVTGTASAAGGTAPYTYNWNWGDGNTSTGASVTHTYTSPGSYTITVTVTDATGSQAPASTQILVASPLGVTIGLS